MTGPSEFLTTVRGTIKVPEPGDRRRGSAHTNVANAVMGKVETEKRFVVDPLERRVLLPETSKMR
jgi:hypothetical protein